MGSLSKLPPEVARELRRHVSPRPLSQQRAKAAAAAAANQQNDNQGRSNNTRWVLAGCVAFTGAAFSIPFFAQKWIGNLNSREDPLTPAQIRRGAFLNSGSKDMGKDPQWDFVRGQYKKDDNYWAIFDNDAAQQAFGSIVSTGGTGGNNKTTNKEPVKPSSQTEEK